MIDIRRDCGLYSCKSFVVNLYVCTWCVAVVEEDSHGVQLV